MSGVEVLQGLLGRGDLALTQERLDLVLAARDEIMATLPGLILRRSRLTESLGNLLAAEHDDHVERVANASRTGIDRGLSRDLSSEIADPADDRHAPRLDRLGKRRARGRSDHLAGEDRKSVV